MKKNILLASKSPRRQQLLRDMGFQFSIVSMDVDESFEGIEPLKVAAYLAEKKSLAYTILQDNEVLITSDTTVLLGNEILNKPANKEEAFEMLQKLSGKTHAVITGVCIRTIDHIEVFSELTRVSMATLSHQDISYYIEHFAPFDKAGSYGIQEWIGLTHVTGIAGCYYNVMGLPTAALYERLKKFV